MNLTTRLDQKSSSTSSSSSIRRSSLVVNLSTCSKRSSSITTSLNQIGQNQTTSRKEFNWSSCPLVGSSQRSSDSFHDSACKSSSSLSRSSQRSSLHKQQLNSQRSFLSRTLPQSVNSLASPQSAPPFSSKPSYRTITRTVTIMSNGGVESSLDNIGPMKLSSLDNQHLLIENTSLLDANHLQVSSLSIAEEKSPPSEPNPIVEEPKSEESSRRNSKEENSSPEPIVVVKNTSSSSNNNSSSSAASSSDCEDSSSSRRLIRRRTVRRYQRATTTEEQEEPAEASGATAELTVSINRSAGAAHEQREQVGSLEGNHETKSHFRTRQIGSYSYAQQQQQQAKSSSSTTSSKVAKCSITTNRKSTTISESTSTNKAASKQSTSSEQQMAASLQSNGTGSGSPSARLAGSLELRQFKNSDLFDIESSKSFQVKEESESSVHHRESFSSTTSLKRATGSSPFSDNVRKVAANAAASTKSTSSVSTSCESSRHSTLRNLQNQADEFTTNASSSSSSSSSSSRRFKSSSVLISKAAGESFALNSDSLFSSPEVRSLAKEIVTDFAELESALSSQSLSHSNSRSSNSSLCALGPAGSGQHHVSSLSSRLFGSAPRRALSPIQSESSSGSRLAEEPAVERSARRPSYCQQHLPEASTSTGDRIRDLLLRAESCNSGVGLGSGATDATGNSAAGRGKPLALVGSSAERTSAPEKGGSLSYSIEKIDQKMCDLCKKFDECQETQKAIELLEIIIQMIEKAWSVPLCGDDLGFRLCNSLRVAGGLDTILSFIRDADRLPQVSEDYALQQAEKKASEEAKGAADRSGNLLRLDLARLNGNQAARAESPGVASPPASRSSQALRSAKDSDSEAITSDLGLDSTSVESLAYVAAPEPQSANSPAGERLKKSADEKEREEAEEAALRKEELVFLSAKLLSQCLTSENRSYIVANGLQSVIKLACNFTIMKSSQSQQLLSRSMIMRQSSSVRTQAHREGEEELAGRLSSKGMPESPGGGSGHRKRDEPGTARPREPAGGQPEPADGDHSVVHAIIGTETLQHLFKHSEETCSKMVSLGALQAILYACRSSNAETLRHCASALANLALYGGPDIQQTMIERQAHHWLFPLAFNEDDNVQYYACLAIVVLAANQEIEADVQKSGTLDLVEPFVTLHEPQKFAESTTAHIHGQSASWLRRLVPLLKSSRLEARSLACFHFAMEAYIKKEQGQTGVFKEIEAVEILQKMGSSPISCISKFSCQALRLIGEPEPHRLSQHVPKWTCEDVGVWVQQIGFGQFGRLFEESHVDGDLLLQLDEETLRHDMNIENGIIRRKFLRELSKLKQIADYSSVDKSNLSALLKSEAGNEFLQYVYMMIQLGVSSQNIHWLDSEQLIGQCKISNPIHQIRLTQAIKSVQSKMAKELAELRELEGEVGWMPEQQQQKQQQQKKTLDVFISYRRSNGSQLASLLKVHLQLRHFSVFIDVERLEAGKFDNNLLDSIRSAKNFILVLSPNALERCIGDLDCKDWVHKEIVAAIENKCNIIPVMDNFHWPDADQLPEDMRSIVYFNGVRWIHDYQDACVDKIERFIRGELINGYTSLFHPTGNSQPPSSSAGNHPQRVSASSAPGNAQNFASTPNIIASTPSTAATFAGCQSMARIPPPPFDSDHHPLSFAAHSQPASAGSGSLSAASTATSAASANHNPTQASWRL